MSESKEYFLEDTKMGGKVFILNTGAKIGAEETAMLQALHSRSLGGIQEHLKNLAEKGAGKFMSSFYVGYGHKSIGDCGTTTIFIENVSILAAKAIQDWPLYSGQESSTRYIPFENQPFLNPANSIEGEEILEKWRSFYKDNMEAVREELKGKYPIEKGQSESVYIKAINARAFDIMRCYLPVGVATNLSWHTNLRQASDKLMLMRHHPLEEVRQLAEAIETALIKAYPNSFEHERFEATERYNKFVMQEYYYHNLNSPDFSCSGAENIDLSDINSKILKDRPMKTELPKWVNTYGTLSFEFNLDYGSFKDIQRHRATYQRMPLATTDLGFEDWYLDQLPENVKKEAINLIKEQEEAINNLDVSAEERQYYVAKGHKISNKLSVGLAALVYLVELRSTRFVHPTVVNIARKMVNVLRDNFPDLTLYIDETPHQFDIGRGEHDIVEK